MAVAIFIGQYSVCDVTISLSTETRGNPRTDSFQTLHNSNKPSMSKHGLRVEDFGQSKRHTQDYIRHRARCGKLRSPKTSLQNFYDQLEVEQNGRGWRHCYFPHDRQSDWKSVSDDWSETDEKYGNAAINEINKIIAKNSLLKQQSLQNVQSRHYVANYASQDEVDTRRGDTEKQSIASMTKIDEENRKKGPKPPLSNQSRCLSCQDVSLAETMARAARDQRSFSNRLRELSNTSSMPSHSHCPTVTNKSIGANKSKGVEKFTGSGVQQDQLPRRNVAARTKRRIAAMFPSKVSHKAKNYSTNTSEFANPSKAFQGFTIYGEQSFRLKPTFPENFKDEDPAEYKALASKPIRLDITFKAKSDAYKGDFPYHIIIQERLLTQDSCRSTLALYPAVKTFTTERLEFGGEMSSIYGKEPLKFTLRVFPEVTCSGRVKYTGTYRRQMKANGQFITWKFEL